MRAVRGNTSSHLNLLTGQQSPGLGQGRRGEFSPEKWPRQGRYLVNDTEQVPRNHHARVLFYLTLEPVSFALQKNKKQISCCRVGARPEGEEVRSSKKEQIGASGAPGSILIDSERGVSTFLTK